MYRLFFKMFMLGSVFILSVFAVTGTGFTSDRVYRIHCDNTPPYTFLEDESTKNVSGLWTEMVRAVLKRMGIEHEKIRIYPWARILHEGVSGTIDGVFGAQINEERLGQMRFPEEPLTEETWVFWIRKSDVGRLKYTSFDDLKGHSIGLVRGYNYPKAFKAFVRKEQNFEDVSEERQNFKKLAAGRIDYTVSLLNIGTWIARNEGFLDQIYPLTEKTLFTSKFYVMFNKKNISQEWVDRLSKELVLYKKTAEFRTLLEKFGMLPQ
ncbi:MAG: transporter substrate-binding domain-containing protein [Desulfobacterium sp.]|nr:transporter substrate-binding domain-containing protein [Desulfobacterium sp.]